NECCSKGEDELPRPVEMPQHMCDDVFLELRDLSPNTAEIATNLHEGDLVFSNLLLDLIYASFQLSKSIEYRLDSVRCQVCAAISRHESHPTAYCISPSG